MTHQQIYIKIGEGPIGSMDCDCSSKGDHFSYVEPDEGQKGDDD